MSASRDAAGPGRARHVLYDAMLRRRAIILMIRGRPRNTVNTADTLASLRVPRMPHLEYAAKLPAADYGTISRQAFRVYTPGCFERLRAGHRALREPPLTPARRGHTCVEPVAARRDRRIRHLIIRI